MVGIVRVELYVVYRLRVCRHISRWRVDTLAVLYKEMCVRGCVIVGLCVWKRGSSVHQSKSEQSWVLVSTRISALRECGGGSWCCRVARIGCWIINEWSVRAVAWQRVRSAKTKWRISRAVYRYRWVGLAVGSTSPRKVVTIVSLASVWYSIHCSFILFYSLSTGD